MKYARTLSRDEMKNIMAGGCRIFIRNDDGSGGHYSGGCFSVSEAKNLYNGTPQKPWISQAGTHVSGYCCASCGEAPFENADPC